MTTVIESFTAEDIQHELKGTPFVVPHADVRVYKDECTHCYNYATFGGLYVCLNSYHCFCKEHLETYVEKTGRRVFVHVESCKVSLEKEKTSDEGTGEPQIKKLAIGKEGGFDVDKHELVDQYHLVIYPNLDRLIPIMPALGDGLYEAAHHVATCTSAERLEMLQNASNAWDGEIKLITKHIDLPQLETNGKVIPTSGWKCEMQDCELTENLWLNLSDGIIKCGRSQYLADGKLSSGNNHMRQHWELTGFPLVVKLGTIANGSADVYSYDEDDAVIDGKLKEHLAHWGLDVDTMKKTEKSTLEMELDMNQKWEWAKCVEDGASLENKYGAGYTGLINIGSSCYMNSVVQAMLLLPSIHERFVINAKAEFERIPLEEIHTDFNAQVTKLFKSMMTGEHAAKELEEKSLNGIKPKQFKQVVAGQHPEFRTAAQQDAEEYLRHLVDRITKATPPDVRDATLPLKFQMEARFEDLASGKVRYSDKEELILGLPVREELMIPMEAKEGETEKRFEVSLDYLIESAFAPSHIDDYKSPVTGEVKGATTTLRFKTFPEYLVIQIQKFALGPDMRVRKFDMDVHVNDQLDLTSLRGTGKKPDEVLLPDNVDTATTASLPDYDKTVADQLKQMGFSENASIRAAIEVRSANGNAEQAMEWLLPRLDDSSINEPVQPVVHTVNKKAAAERPCVKELVGFGFTGHQACFALNKFQDVNQAAEWLFEHASEVPPEEEQAGAETATSSTDYSDGNGKYNLIGFISHMGSSPHSGHYVAHLLKEGKWILYNDEKVAVSQNPPRQLAYLYIFKRI